MLTSPAPTPLGLGTARHVKVAIGATLLQVATSLFVGLGFINPLIAKELGVGMAQLMAYFSIHMLTAAFAMTAVGPRFTRRFGSRAMVAGFGMATALGVLVMSFAGSLLAVYACGFALGLTFGAATTMQASLLVNTWFEERRGAVLGVVMGVGGLGGAILGFLMPPLLEEFGWRGAMRFLAFWVLLLTQLPAWLLIRSRPEDVGLVAFGAGSHEHRPAHLIPTSVGLRRALGSPQFWAIVGAWLVQGFNMGVHQQLAPMLANKGQPLTLVGSVISALSFCIICSGVALGFVFDRIGATRTMAIGYATQTLAMLGFFAAAAYLPLLGSAVLLSVSSAMTGIFVPILLVRVFGPRDYVSILGPVMASQAIGSALGAPVWGWVFDHFGNYQLALAAAAVGSLSVGGLFAYALRSAHTLHSRVRFESELPQPSRGRGPGALVGTGRRLPLAALPVGRPGRRRIPSKVGA